MSATKKLKTDALAVATLGPTLCMPVAPERLRLAESHLVLEQKQLSPLAEAGVLTAYTVVADRLHVPKQWGLDNLECLGIGKVVDCQAPATPVDMPDVQLPYGLRPHQQEAFDTVMERFNSHEHKQLGTGCIISMGCGFGKTVCSLYIASKMKLKTLIVTHTAVLAEQWVQAIEQYAPGTKVGRICQDKFDVHGVSHAVASLHSIARRDYDWPAAGFNVLLVDEVHHLSAVQLSQAIAKAGCRYRIGLSATPERADGLSSFLGMSIGPIVFSITRGECPDLRVFKVVLEPGTVQNRTVRKASKECPNIAGMLNDLVAKTVRAHTRQCLAAKWIAACIAEGRKVIVLADRIQLLESLAEMLQPLQCGFMIGKTKQKDRETAKAAPVIFASYQVCSEGLDISSLDTILLLTPRSGSACITQCVGRILREGGLSPLVIDFVDAVSLFQGMYYKRLPVYRQHGAAVSTKCEDEISLDY